VEEPDPQAKISNEQETAKMLGSLTIGYGDNSLKIAYSSKGESATV
jgi:hypothetical protein